MSRPAHARQQILEAAEAIVARSGAGALTFDELVRRSGITRGGITYHFPTKQALLKALVDNDLARWESCVREEAQAWPDDPLALLRAYITGGCEPDETSNRLCAGLLATAVEAPELNEPWRDYFAQHQAWIEKTSDPTLALIVSLAVDGLYWADTLSLMQIPAGQRQQLVARLLDLVDRIEPQEAA